MFFNFIFNNTDIFRAAESGALDFPDAEPLDGFANDLIPYFFVGDEAFALKTWMQRPYPVSYTHLTLPTTPYV